MQFPPDASLMPVTQVTPATHAGATAQFLREISPRGAGAQHQKNTGQSGTIMATGTTAFRRSRVSGRSGWRVNQSSSGKIGLAMMSEQEIDHPASTHFGGVCLYGAGNVRRSKLLLWMKL